MPRPTEAGLTSAPSAPSRPWRPGRLRWPTIDLPPLGNPAERQARLREARILDALNAGKSVAEIARAEGVGEKRLRALLREFVARQGPWPPAAYVARETARLASALDAAFDAMGPKNLKAVDEVGKIVRELDGLHGFVPPRARRLASRPPAASWTSGPIRATAAFVPTLRCRAAFAGAIAANSQHDPASRPTAAPDARFCALPRA